MTQIHEEWLVIRKGRDWHKVSLPSIAANVLKISMSEVKKLIKQKGLEFYIEEKDETV